MKVNDDQAEGIASLRPLLDASESSVVKSSAK